MRIIMKAGSYHFLLKKDTIVWQATEIIDGAIEVEKVYHQGKWSGVPHSKTDFQLIVLADGAVAIEEEEKPEIPGTTEIPEDSQEEI